MNQNNIPRGQLPTIILSTLLSGDKYGYEIINGIKESTNGEVVIKQPSLYSSLTRMEKQGFISSYWRDSEIGGKRHYYSITDLGKKQFDNLEETFYSAQEKVSNVLINGTNTDKPINDSTLKTNGKNNAKLADLENKGEEILIEKNDIPVTDFQENNIIKNTTIPPLQNLETQDNAKIKTENFDNTKKESLSTENNLKQENIFTNPKLNFEDNLRTKKENEKYVKSLQYDIFEQKEDIIQKTFNLENEFEELKNNIPSYTDEVKKRKSLNDYKIYYNEDNSIKTDFTEINLNTSEDNKNIIEMQTAEIILDNDNELSHNTVNNINKNNNSSQNANVRKDDKPKNDAKFIKERYTPDQIPKVKKLNVEHLDTIKRNENDHLSKLNPNKLERGYTEKINELYNKSKNINEKDFYTDEEQPTPTYEELEKYYKDMDIKFSICNKKEEDKNKTRNKSSIEKSANSAILNKLFLYKYLCLFGCVVLETIIALIVFKQFEIVLQAEFMFYLLPFIFAIPSIVLLCNKSLPRKSFEFNSKSILLDLAIFVVGLILIYSINMLFGMDLTNILNYSTTFIYFAILWANLLIIVLANHIINNKINKKQQI